MNYKHLHYFWMVARTGSIARAGEQLHVTPQTISGQLAVFEAEQGQTLFEKHGRNLVLTEAGRLVLGYADEIFSLGRELEQVLHQSPDERVLRLRVGVSDVVAKAVAYRLLEPALALPQTVHIQCREGKLEYLLEEVGRHKLDLVLTDNPAPASMAGRAHSHLLGESGVGFYATPDLAKRQQKRFPASLHDAPLLLPGEDSALRSRILHWLNQQQLQPRVVGEFDDSALMSAFGQAGAGIFAAPTAIADMVVRQYEVCEIGRTDDIREQFYAISMQRKSMHPAVRALIQAKNPAPA